MAEPPVQSRVTQACPVGAVAAPVVGAVALLVAVLPVQPLRTAVLAHVPADAGGAPAVPTHRVTGGPVLALTGEGAVLAEGAGGTGLVAHGPRPAFGTVAAVSPLVTRPAVGAVVAGQAAVVAEGVVQTHKFLLEGALGPKLSQALVIVVVAFQWLGVVLEQRDWWPSSLHGQATGQSFHRVAQSDAGAAVLRQTVPQVAVALVRPGCVLAGVFTPSILSETLVHVITATSIGVEPVSCPAVALVPPRVVGTVLFTAGAAIHTLVQIHAGLQVIVQVVSTVTATDGPIGGVLAVVRTASVGGFAAVNDLHLDAVALLAISTQLISRVTDAAEGASGVMATMGTGGLTRLTLVNVFTGFAVPRQPVSRVTVAVRQPSVVVAHVHAASIPVSARARQFAVLAILSQLVVVSAAAVEVSWGKLDAVLLTAAIADCTGEDSDAGAGVRVEAGPGVALAVVGAPGVDASVLAATIVDLALIDIRTEVSHVVPIISRKAGVTVPLVVPVSVVAGPRD